MRKRKEMRVWSVEAEKCDGPPLCNLFYTRDEARTFARELKAELGGKWFVYPTTIQIHRPEAR